MKKMTPMILVILMLTSFLSAVDVYELQEESNNESKYFEWIQLEPKGPKIFISFSKSV